MLLNKGFPVLQGNRRKKGNKVSLHMGLPKLEVEIRSLSERGKNDLQRLINGGPEGRGIISEAVARLSEGIGRFL